MSTSRQNRAKWLKLPAVLLALVAATFVSGRSSFANDEPTPAATSASETAVRLWLVRTYGLGDPGDQVADLQQLDVQRLEADQWRSESARSLVDSASERTTIVYVHGNRGNDGDAIARGKRLGQILAARPEAPPLQVVIWSWPSGRAFRGRFDFVFKAERTDTEAWYLAALLRQFPPRANVGMLGYSYGGRVITGAMHWHAGGTFEGRSLPTTTTAPRPYRVALLAPAVHVNWLASEGTHGEAWQVADRLLLFFNPCDPALRWYKFLYRGQRPTALGHFGISESWLGESATRIEQWDVSPTIGRSHDEDDYLYSPWISDQIGQFLLPTP